MVLAGLGNSAISVVASTGKHACHAPYDKPVIHFDDGVHLLEFTSL
jgi:hypothetical protein